MGDVVPFDPWDVESAEEYDPDDFYCGSVDVRGHHSSMQISVKPDISGQIDALVASKMFPAYKTKGHFARDTMVHRLHYLAERGQMPELLRFVRIEMQAAELDALKYEHEKLTKMLEDYEILMRMKRDRNDRKGLAIAVEKVIKIAEGQEEPWDDQFLELANKYTYKS